MKDFESQPWAQFAEDFANEMLNHHVTQAVTLTRCEDEDRVAANYYNTDFEMRWAFLGHMMVDLVLQIIGANREMVLQILAGEDDEEAPDKEE